MALEEYAKNAEGGVKYSLERIDTLIISLSSGVYPFDLKSVKKLTTNQKIES